MPGHWAARALLESLDLELCREEERPSGFRRSLIGTQGRWGPACKQEGSGGPARPRGHCDRQAPGLLRYFPDPALSGWLLSQTDLGRKTLSAVATEPSETGSKAVSASA